MARLLKPSQSDLLALQPALALQHPARRSKVKRAVPMAPFNYGVRSSTLRRGHFVDLTV